MRRDRLLAMNFGKWIGVAVLWLGCGLAAEAQFGAYVGYTGVHLSGIQCLSVGVACANGPAGAGGSVPGATGGVNPSGIFFGGYYDFRTVGPVRLGADVRYLDMRSNKSAASSLGGPDATNANTVLAGVRGTFHTRYSFLRPYVELAAGRTSSDATEPGATTTTTSTSTTSITSPRRYDNFLQYNAFAGVDLKIFSVLDLRVVEVGVGNMNRFGSGSGSTSVGVTSIGAAVVFHLPE
jgi:hypothetical protein